MFAYRSVELALCLGFAFFPILSFAVTSEIVKIKELAKSKSWRKLMHYDSNSISGDIKSRIDDPRFFFSPVGQFNPHAELEGLVIAITNNKKKSGERIKCIVPFRYRFVVEAGLVPVDLGDCPKLQFYKKNLGLGRLSIVHVAQYADNPSSILGHLFLQFMQGKREGFGKSPRYLNKTVNYAASVPADSGILKFMIAGIFGGFKGRYTLYQYADMIEKYNNAESRDLFVYQLNYSKLEIEKVIGHVWELTNFATQDYYFFYENCAFQILAILEAVRPGLELTAQLPFYTTPIDILKIVEKEHLISNVEYVPSLYQRYSDKLSAMNSVEKANFEDFLESRIPPRKIQSKLVVDALIDAFNFRRNENQGIVSARFVARENQLLSHRASLGIHPPSHSQTVKISPHLSHGAARVSLGAGFENSLGTVVNHDAEVRAIGSRSYRSFRFRLAIHDLLSRSDGFQRNSAISLLNIEIRKYENSGRVSLTEIQLLSIAKLFGTRTLHRLAWDFDLKLTEKNRRCGICLSPDFEALLGMSKNMLPDLLDVFLMLKTNYDPEVLGETWEGGLGMSVGLAFSPKLYTENRQFARSNMKMAMNFH